jgi:nucleotide-binding universal stress UspA family protein/predicted transcriptional regulator
VVAVTPPALDPHCVAEAALPYARLIAERTASRVVLVSVVDLLPTFNPLTRTLVMPSLEATERVVSETRDYLERLAARFPIGQVETVVRTGATIRELLAELAERPEPLLVVTSHARRGLDRFLVGSVAFQLVREASCPVLVVRGPGAEAAAEPPRLSKVLVPLDLSPLSEQAVTLVTETLGPADFQVHLLHVVEPLIHRNVAPHEVISVVEPKAQRHLREVAQLLIERGYHVTTDVRPGKPSEVIAQVARELQVDVIAMTTHGRSGWHRVLLGSVAEQLIRTSPVPLLLIRPVASRGSQPETEATEAEAAAEARAWRAMIEAAPALWQRRAREIMVQPVVVAHEDTPLADIVQVMLEKRISSVPVVDDQGKLVGIITESDFVGDGRFIPLAAYQVPQLFREHLSEEAVRRIYQTGREMTAKEIMTHPVIAVAEEDPIGKVVQILLHRNISQVPVVRDGVPVGIIARRDLLKLLLPPEEALVGGAPAPDHERTESPTVRETR